MAGATVARTRAGGKSGQRGRNRAAAHSRLQSAAGLAQLRGSWLRSPTPLQRIVGSHHECRNRDYCKKKLGFSSGMSDGKTA
jgi:hypothetical protein